MVAIMRGQLLSFVLVNRQMDHGWPQFSGCIAFVTVFSRPNSKCIHFLCGCVMIFWGAISVGYEYD